MNWVDPTGGEDQPWYLRAAGWVGENVLVPTVELVFGGSNANAPTSKTAKTYARESEGEQAAKITVTMLGGALFKGLFGPVLKSHEITRNGRSRSRWHDRRSDRSNVPWRP